MPVHITYVEASVTSLGVDLAPKLAFSGDAWVGTVREEPSSWHFRRDLHL